jgi:hypothetical protein
MEINCLKNKLLWSEIQHLFASSQIFRTLLTSPKIAHKHPTIQNSSVKTNMLRCAISDISLANSNFSKFTLRVGWMKKLFGVTLKKAEDRGSGGPSRSQSSAVVGSKKEELLPRTSGIAEAPPATPSSPPTAKYFFFFSFCSSSPAPLM